MRLEVFRRTPFVRRGRDRDHRTPWRAAAGLIWAVAATLACSAAPLKLVLPFGTPGKPYISLVGRVNGIDVWVVNGQYVRERLDEEFTNFGQHFTFRFIPVQEFWLDRENTPGETAYFGDHLLLEYRLMAHGVPYGGALELGDGVELAERKHSALGREGEALVAAQDRAGLLARIHKQALTEYGAGVTVWVVDGELVRDALFIDFTEGGHDKVYAFVPPKEVWLDDDLMPEERRFVLLHELFERRLMSKGWTYPRAHHAASRIESRCRRRPERLDAALKAEVEANR